MITREDIEEARDKIASLFIEQCQHGAQTRDLQGGGVAACGQFLSDRRSRQRGIHGTAGAISVLARTAVPSARGLAASMLNYLTKRRQVECADVGTVECTERTAKINLDMSNVIKISEILWALSFVQPAIGEKETLTRGLAQQLTAGLREGRGWSYFLDDQNGPEPLPTAFAARALASNGYAVDEPVAYLVDSMNTPPTGQSDVFIQAALLFVLTFLNPMPQVVTREQLRLWLFGIWRRLEPLMDHDLEYNVEYSHIDRNYYIRVPWQLYLVAVAANLAELRVFSTTRLQRRLGAIIIAAMGPSGFVYPHSGNKVSSRTNAILFDVLTLVSHEIGRAPFMRSMLTRLDGVRLILGSAAVSWAGLVVGLVIAAYATIEWLRHGDAALAQLGPNLVAAAVILLLSGRKRR